MTPAEIIYQRRLAVLDHAERTANVAEACRVFGVSRRPITSGRTWPTATQGRHSPELGVRLQRRAPRSRWRWRPQLSRPSQTSERVSRRVDEVDGRRLRRTGGHGQVGMRLR